VIVVELFVDRGAFQSGGNIRTRIDEGFVPQLFDFKNFILRAEGLFEPHDHVLFEEVDHSDEIIFATEGKLQGNGVGSEALANGADDVVKIRAHAVHLVDETDSRDAILVGLTPYGFRLRLHAGDRVEYADRAVQYAQRALHFDGEVHVAGRVD